MAKFKKAQAGISTSGTSRVGKNKMVTVGKAKGENYKVKTKIVTEKGDNATGMMAFWNPKSTTKTTKASRTLKGFLSGAPSPKKLGIHNKRQAESGSDLYKKVVKFLKRRNNGNNEKSPSWLKGF